jgi:peptide/nickel transport system substrate-binding protein
MLTDRRGLSRLILAGGAAALAGAPGLAAAQAGKPFVHAIPHDRIIRTALAGRGSRPACFYNPQDITCNNTFERYALNHDAARRLLKEAGKEGITFDFWYSNALPYNSDIAILIADSLKQIGVTATLRPTPALQLLDAVRACINGAEQAMSGMYLSEGVIWLNDPSTLTNLAVATKTPTAGVTNWARYSDAEVDALHQQFRNSADAPARRVAYQRIQDKLAEAAATANPLVVLGRTIVTSSSITGVTFSQDPYARYVYLRPRTA